MIIYVKKFNIYFFRIYIYFLNNKKIFIKNNYLDSLFEQILSTESVQISYIILNLQEELENFPMFVICHQKLF